MMGCLAGGRLLLLPLLFRLLQRVEDVQCSLAGSNLRRRKARKGRGTALHSIRWSEAGRHSGSDAS